jgi:hypothetical protein
LLGVTALSHQFHHPGGFLPLVAGGEGGVGAVGGADERVEP